MENYKRLDLFYTNLDKQQQQQQKLVRRMDDKENVFNCSPVLLLVTIKFMLAYSLCDNTNIIGDFNSWNFYH